MSLSQIEADEFLEVFKHMDFDGDGFLFPNDISRLFDSIGRSPSQKEITQLLMEISGEQFINPQAFLKFAGMQLKSSDVESDMSEVFRLLDTDKDDYIDLVSVQKLLAHFNVKMTEKEIKDMVSRVSKEAALSGRIDFDTFVKMVRID